MNVTLRYIETMIVPMIGRTTKSAIEATRGRLKIVASGRSVWKYVLLLLCIHQLNGFTLRLDFIQRIGSADLVCKAVIDIALHDLR